MSLLIQKIANLLNGVSQLPETQRLPTQADEQVNGLTSIAHGVRKRPPTQHLAKLTSIITGLDTAFVHTVNRDEDERYHLVVANGAAKAYDAVTGDEVPVQAPGGSGYLADTDGKGFRAVTVGDTTILVNRNVATKRGTKKSPPRAFEALIHVAQADFSTIYSVKLNDSTVAVVTPDADNPEDRKSISTVQIATDLLTALEREVILTDDFTFARVGSSIHVRRQNFGDFTLSSTDGLADEGLKIIKGTVQAFEDLPPRAPQGFTVEVVGTPDSEFDNYFVQYDNLGHPDQNGVWRECPEPSTLVNLDASTMPHRFVLKGSLDADGTPHEGLPEVLGTVARSTSGTNFEDATWSHLVPSGAAIPAGTSPTATEHLSGWKYTVSGSAPGGAYIYYGVDVTQLAPGVSVYVRLYRNSVLVDSGLHPLNRLDPTSYKVDLGGRGFYVKAPALSNLDLLELKLEYSTGATPNSLNRATMIYRLEPKPIVLVRGFRAFINLRAHQTDYYPVGSTVKITLDSTEFSHTVTSADASNGAVGAALAALIDAHADFDVVQTLTGDMKSFSVERTNAAEFTTEFSALFGSGLIYHNHNLALTPSAHVGRLIRNLTDGSTGTITANTATTVTVTSLTGGADNIFQRGDVCSIQGIATDIYFVFEPIPWKEREAGSLLVVPFPSFIDRALSEVFFYQNRVGFLSDENIVFSSSGDLFNLFRYTATELRADDVIDVKSSHADVTLFDSAFLWQGGLYVKSDNVWFQVSGDPVLTPTTIRLDPVGRFPSSRDPRPVVSAGRVFFTRAKSGKTQVFEADLDIREDGSVEVDARDITKDLPTYIEGAPVAMAGDSADGFLALLTSANSQRFLYIYRFHYEGREKVFSSWSRWEFPNGTRLLALGMADGVLGLIRKHSDGAFIEQVDLDLTPLADEASAYLDRRVASGLSPSYSAGTDTTTWTLPYSVATDGSEGVVAVVNRTTGTRYAVTRPLATTVAVTGQGDLTGASVYVGVQYTFLYRLSRLLLRFRETTETSGRTRINLLDLFFNGSTDFTVTVGLVGRTAKTHTFQQATPGDGKKRIPVMGNTTDATITVTNATPGPCAISEIEWEAYFTNRGRRI